MFRWIRWHMAKRRLASGIEWRILPPHVRLSNELNKREVKDFPPTVRHYERLASLWEDFSAWSQPDYGSFLTSAEAYFNLAINSVLDLACGTGVLSRQLGEKHEFVVGLDASAAMLREARSRDSNNGHRYIEGDFRNFRLQAIFDAAICGSDSLNYVETPEQLGDVFRCVHLHLRSGGLFLFDVLDQATCRALAYVKQVVRIGNEPFELYHFYEPTGRRCESRVVFQDAIERHGRIPIDEQDVRHAAAGAGLDVVEHFATKTHSYARQFYVLRKP